MTKDEIIRAVELKVEGKTLEEISAEMRISTQELSWGLMGIAAGSVAMNWASGALCIYPGLVEWGMATGTNANMLGKLMRGRGLVVHNPDFYKRLQGILHFRIHEIQTILDITGLTYETVFGRVTEPIMWGVMAHCEQ